MLGSTTMEHHVRRIKNDLFTYMFMCPEHIYFSELKVRFSWCTPHVPTWQQGRTIHGFMCFRLGGSI